MEQKRARGHTCLSFPQEILPEGTLRLDCVRAPTWKLWNLPPVGDQLMSLALFATASLFSSLGVAESTAFPPLVPVILNFSITRATE